MGWWVRLLPIATGTWVTGVLSMNKVVDGTRKVVFWSTLSLFGFGMAAVGCSGRLDDSFAQPFRDALVKELAAENPQPISLADFTEFEWDYLDVFHNTDSVFSVWDSGIPWLLYSFVHTPFSGYHLWVFRKGGVVTRYATIVSHTRFDPANPVQELSTLPEDLPQLPRNFHSLRKEEAVFKLIRLTDESVPNRKHDFLFPVASVHPENSWRGVFQECIERTSVLDRCWTLATERHPYKSTKDWPR